MVTKTGAATNAAPLEDIRQRLVRIVAEARRRQHALSRHFGVTVLQYTAIHILRLAGPLNITRLAEVLHLNQSTVSSLVDRMERDGLVRKLQSSKDRRSVRLRLTDRADELADRIGLSPFDLVDRVLAVLSSDEQRQFAGMLEKLERAMFEELGSLDNQIKRRQMAEPSTAKRGRT